MAETWFSPIGVTVHGDGSTEKAIREMSSKLDSRGVFALNPQFNILKKDGVDVVGGSLVLDCYGHLAGFLGKGKSYQVTDTLSLGYVFGVYVRLNPHDLGLDMFTVGAYQIIPTPTLSAEYKISDNAVLRMNSNYYINFFDVAWRF